MDATISKLEYTLKDQDVQSQPYLVHQIKEVIMTLKKIMATKRARWAQEEKTDGTCPCGCDA